MGEFLSDDDKDAFRTGRFGGKSLTPTQQRALLAELDEANLEIARLNRRLDRLKSAVDAGMDSGYKQIEGLKDCFDAFNVLTHRTALNDRRLDDD